MKRFFFAIIFLIPCGIALCQNPKSYFKEGTELYEKRLFSEAIEQFDAAISIDPEYSDAYLGRGKALIKKNEILHASTDFIKAISLDQDNEDYYFWAAKSYFISNNLAKANEYLETAIGLKSNNASFYVLKAKLLVEENNLEKAKSVSETALTKDNNAETNYIVGYVLSHTDQYQDAEMYFLASIKKDDGFSDSYYELAKLKLKADQPTEALAFANKAILANNYQAKYYLLRCKIYKIQSNINLAINDISKAISLEENNANYYMVRGLFYSEISKYQEAIDDFTEVLNISNKNLQAYFNRGKAYEMLGKKESALHDYKTIVTSPQNDDNAELLTNSKKRIYELNRETTEPEITLSSSYLGDNAKLNIPQNITNITLQGTVTDQSPIRTFKINGTDHSLTQSATNANQYQFSLPVTLSSLSAFTIESDDIYGNKKVVEYPIYYTETQAPRIKLIAPYATENNMVTLSGKGPNILIEGVVSDESKIKSIKVDDVVANYEAENINPTFAATVNIKDKKSITIIATDQYGNQAKEIFAFNQERSLYTSENPMGKTWVVFIENSKYENYPSLEGPAKDVSSMSTALSNYQIHNFIHKKNLTKTQMERFFNTELRNLVRSNQVNSLLIWYAGHGKTINETGYWIPIDAKRDDEFSFFNNSNLRASMQLYSKFITHLLIVTDACESGPSFYQAMRGGLNRPDCSDANVSRFKSSQVFASAGYELAVGNSQFTKTFANTLSNNNQACIPIDDIVVKVREAVKGNTKQVPRFGKIQGLEHEDGTFLFIAK